ncbi:MAG: TATA-box-binding protein [Candidatus Bathyarchaeota archaeon]|nr:TATA-box-binding protein [Candidatus Bathyarchaeota archaeon]MDH5663002.1 TATA-box-binding protein [Candidatus Bathyarchaeota archaeon]
MSKAEPIVKIENIVASATVKHRIELSSVVKAFPDAEYRPGRFPGLVFRLKKPKTSTLIFSSGKMICTGAASENEARRALRKLVKVLKEGGILIVGKPEMKIVNVVATVNLGGSVDLLELYESERGMRGKIVYEPEQFPGLIYRMEGPRVVFLIFSSGKLVCTGARREEDVHQAVMELHRKLEQKNLINHEE